MSADIIERCAAFFQTARSNGRLLAELPADLKPHSLADAYAVQDRLFELLGGRVGGWFLGCTNPTIQRQLGIGHPYAARLMDSVIHASPVRLAFPVELPVVLEVEFAFRLGADLPARKLAYSIQEVAEAVATVHPAIEVVISHLADWTQQPFLDLVADNGTDGALVYGDGLEAWQDLDLNKVVATLTVDGEVVEEGGGTNIDGGPLAMLTWLANHVSQKGLGLKAGQICNTGSCTSIHYVEKGTQAVATFSDLGSVSIEVAGNTLAPATNEG